MINFVCDLQVFTWGYNANGQLGNECTSNQSTPVHVALGNQNYEQIYMLHMYICNYRLDVMVFAIF